MSATTSAITSPSANDASASGMVPVSPPQTIGQNESRNSCQSRMPSAARPFEDVGRERTPRRRRRSTSRRARRACRPRGASRAPRRRPSRGRLVLREGEGVLRSVVGLGGDLEPRVGRPRVLVVEVGELVVDGRVDAALLEQRDGLRPALDGLDVRAALLGELVPVARQRLRGGLARRGRRSSRSTSSPSFTTTTPGDTVYGVEKT